ncbi:hypothetical protein P692DRAFT_20927486, partial [Suillus brevipes Sb2]
MHTLLPAILGNLQNPASITNAVFCWLRPPGHTKHCPLRGDIRKIGTIQRRLAWPLHKDDTLSRSG